jgi:hypothetical protein
VPSEVETGKVVEVDALAREYTAILEYELPMESRRPDVVLLVSGAVVVLELKGKTEPDQACRLPTRHIQTSFCIL